MIHIAILVVLIIIALVIAPWLIGVAVAVVVTLAAAYGVYVFVVVALAGSVLALIGIWYLFKWLTHKNTPLAERGPQYSTPEHRMNQLRSIEDSLRQQDLARTATVSGQGAAGHDRRKELARSANVEIYGERVACKSCQVEIYTGGTYCPSCSNSDA